MIGGHLSPLPAVNHHFIFIEIWLPCRMNDSRSGKIKAKTKESFVLFNMCLHSERRVTEASLKMLDAATDHRDKSM